jgi:hypothetical protein
VNSQGNTKQKSNAGDITIPKFKLYYRGKAIKMASYWQKKKKNRHEEQWNRTEDPDMNPHNYTHFIFDKGTKKHTMEKRQPVKTNVAEKIEFILRKLKLDSFLSPFASISTNWIKDLNIRPDNLKLVQERAGNTLELIGIGSVFLNRTQMAQQLKERTT